MTITANPSVRQVLAAVVQDPEYPAVAEKPVVESGRVLPVAALIPALFAGLFTWRRTRA